MTSTELVGPVETVKFMGGPTCFTGPHPTVIYDVPASTLDHRYQSCTDHHVACDCREADLAEVIGELRSELDAIIRIALEVCDGHATEAWEDERYQTGCMCTGCQIIRRAHLLGRSTPYDRERKREQRDQQVPPDPWRYQRIGDLILEPRDGDRYTVWRSGGAGDGVLLADGTWSTDWRERHLPQARHRWEDAVRLARADQGGQQ